MFYSCILWLSYQLIILLKNNNNFVRCNITNQIMTFSNMFGISIMVVCKIVQAFALLCDGGTDDGGDKDFVILVRVFDEGALCSLTKFLALPTCNIGTGENMFATIEACLRIVLTHLTII